MRASRQTTANPAQPTQDSGRSRVASLVVVRKAIHALGLYIACAITACGWGFFRILEVSTGEFPLLWFAGAILIYNIDRLKTDPADLINVPARRAASDELRRFAKIAAMVALILLIGSSALSGSWLLLLLTLPAAGFCASYSISTFGLRLKDLPVLKTFFAPTVLTAAYLSPVFLTAGLQDALKFPLLCAIWLWLFLTFNMILCDLRDLKGDRIAGTRSLPVMLGSRITGQLLWWMIVVTTLTGLLALTSVSGRSGTSWVFLVVLTAGYQIGLLRTPLEKRDESFYEWNVEGLLFLPAIAAWVMTG